MPADTLKVETNTEELREEIEAAFNVSDFYEAFYNECEAEGPDADFAVDVFFEHGQWFVNVIVNSNDARTVSYSVAESGDDFIFEEL